MPAFHLRRTLEHADGRSGLAFASDSLEAADADAAILKARELCRKADRRGADGSGRADPVVVQPGAGPGAALRPAHKLSPDATHGTRAPLSFYGVSLMATIAILIGTRAGARLLAAASEREAALSAEAFLLRLPVRTLPAPLWVQCADPAVSGRLTAYLNGLQDEQVRERDARV
jgi:hypothetical protein